MSQKDDSVDSLGIQKEQRIGQHEELHIAGQTPTPVDAQIAMVEEILDEEQIAPPVLRAELIVPLVDVVHRSVSNIDECQVHAAHDNQIERSQSQITMEEKLSIQLGITQETILTHCIHLLGIAQEVVGLQEATKESSRLEASNIAFS